MAHRSDVIQVQRDFPTSDADKEVVTDPVCGMKITKKDARSVIFPEEGMPLYFCSKDCREKFKSQKAAKKTAA